MNELNLRVSGGIGKKVKKPLAPMTMPYWSPKSPGDEIDEFCIKFLNASSADDQLKTMKQYLNSHKERFADKMVEFLVLLFWDADSKHPVKGFLKKHITDSITLREPFTEFLTSFLVDMIAEGSNLHYGEYIGVVTQLDACIDKFPPGMAAVSRLEIQVAMYLVYCLESCIETLSNNEGKRQSIGAKTDPLAPTEINKIYDLAHLTLRLLLYMIQKVTDENRGKLSSMFERIRSITAELMSGKDVPMDTKSVSGIIDFTLHLFENGSDSWVEFLEADHQAVWSGTVALAMYSAVATAVPNDALLTTRVSDQPAVLLLTDRILEIGDRYSSDSSHLLAVARTLHALSKTLGAAVPAVGGPLGQRLLGFCWGHLEHHMDSVRHLAAHIVGNVVASCVRMEKEGDSRSLEHVFSSLEALDGGGRGLLAVLAALAEHAGAGLAARSPGLARRVVAATGAPPAQARAANLLETLIKKHMAVSSTEEIYQEWITVILERVKCESDPTALNILEKVLAKAVQWDNDLLQYILPEQRSLSSYEGSELKCILLVLGVVRRSGVAYNFSHDELMHTAYDADDEIRILSLSLVAGGARSTARLAAAELQFVLHFLQYNANDQAPSFRQLLLAHMEKILKRLEDSFKVLVRKKEDHVTEIASYLNFLEELREQCFGSLVPGANYGRRCCALQVLAWQEALRIDGYERKWTKKHAETLHAALDDSYENNKRLALEVLKTCPFDVLYQMDGYGSAAYEEQVLRQASSLRPADCVSASYRLLLAPRAGVHSLLLTLRRVLCALKEQAARAQNIARVRDAPMFGLVRAAATLLGSVDPKAIAGDGEWSALVADMIATCGVVNSRVAGVVSAASPEGLLPEDVGARSDDGRPVTAQMILLCAWRSVKETSLLLGGLVSRLSIEGEAPAWTLSARQVEDIGTALIELLSTVRHRGAFEQAYVGFTMVLGRLWKCKSPRLHQLPLQWYEGIERDFLLPPVSGAPRQYCATRRGAGLPFMIQALVTTELEAESTAPRGRLLNRCLELCLRALAVGTSETGRDGASGRDGAVGDTKLRLTSDCVTSSVNGNGVIKDSATDSVTSDSAIKHTVTSASATKDSVTNNEAVTSVTEEDRAATVARAHLVLRSLARHAAPPAPALQAALAAAVRGARAPTWTERNSSTLLFSALTVRIFGVQRGRDARKLCARNRMTGRIFFLRYPEMYDFMLEEIQSADAEGELHPSLFPTLLLLARLYPSALEGTVSNLKLSRFLPGALALAGARDAAARRLAARAAAPLVAHRYIPHIESLLTTLNDQNIKMNLCHGILCQLSVLLDSPPTALATDYASTRGAAAAARGSLWLAAARCRPVADEFLTVLNLLLLRFPGCLYTELIPVSAELENAIFDTSVPAITSGRETYLANAVYMYIIIATLTYRHEDIIPFVLRCLRHKDYEVQISALNYLLLLHDQCEELCTFLEHLNHITDKDIKHKFHDNENYVRSLCETSSSFYLECKQKALRVLTYSPRTQKDIVNLKLHSTGELSYEVMLSELLDSAEKAHESLRCIYLESVLTLVTRSLNVGGSILSVARALWDAAATDRAEVVVAYFNTQLGRMLSILPKDPEDRFEYEATLLATAAALLEAPRAVLRLRAAGAVAAHVREMTSSPDRQAVSAARAARELRQFAGKACCGASLLLVLAALDFRAEVAADELGEECRVFEQNETQNEFLEEFTWTRDCAVLIKEIHREAQTLLAHTYTAEQFVRSLANDARYKPTIDKLCIENAVECLSLRARSSHPKIDLFFEVLRQ